MIKSREVFAVGGLTSDAILSGEFRSRELILRKHMPRRTSSKDVKYRSFGAVTEGRRAAHKQSHRHSRFGIRSVSMYCLRRSKLVELGT